MPQSQLIEQELAGFDKTAKNPLDLYNEASAQFGIPEVRQKVSSLRKQILDTENLLSGVEGSVQGRTQGSLVTEAQRQRLTALERQPIAGQHSQLSGAYGQETANLSDITGQAGQQANLAFQGQQEKRGGIKDRLAIAIQKEAEEQRKRELAAAEQRAAESEKRRQFEADRAFSESSRQFNVSSSKQSAENAASSRLDKAESIINKYAHNMGNFRTVGGAYKSWDKAVKDLRAAGYKEAEITSMNNYLASRFGSESDRKYFNVQ